MWEELNANVPLVSTSVYATLLLFELGLDIRYSTKIYEMKDTLCSLTTTFFYLGTQFLIRGLTLFLFYFAWEHRFFELEMGWLAIFLAYLATDFLVYWIHRIIHEVRFGWAAHMVHHSSERFNYATALRQSFAEPFMAGLFYSPAIFLGLHPLAVLIALELSLIYMFWIHTEKVGKLPAWFEWIFSTPSHHRVHHAKNVQYLDKNYGGTLIIWDRLFGTFEPEVEKPVYGIPDSIDSFNPFWVSIAGWVRLFKDTRRAKGLWNKIAYIIMPPGWAPDGKGATTRQLQKQYREEQLAKKQAATNTPHNA